MKGARKGGGMRAATSWVLVAAAVLAAPASAPVAYPQRADDGVRIAIPGTWTIDLDSGRLCGSWTWWKECRDDHLKRAFPDGLGVHLAMLEEEAFGAPDDRSDLQFEIIDDKHRALNFRDADGFALLPAGMDPLRISRRAVEAIKFWAGASIPCDAGAGDQGLTIERFLALAEPDREPRWRLPNPSINLAPTGTTFLVKTREDALFVLRIELLENVAPAGPHCAIVWMRKLE